MKTKKNLHRQVNDPSRDVGHLRNLAPRRSGRILVKPEHVYFGTSYIRLCVSTNIL